MARAILVAVLFAIGLLVLQFLFVDRALKARIGSVAIRGDLWDWVNQRAEESNEQPERIVDCALASYRDRMTGTHTDG